MILKDQKVHDTIERLKNQYHIFSTNKFIKKYLFEAEIPKNDWMDVEDLINSNQYYEVTGYELEKLYDQILTFTSFLTRLERDVVPKMQNESQARINTLSADNRVIFKMTVNNAPGNLKTLADLVRELFINVKELDKSSNGEFNMVLKKKSYFKEIEQKLFP